MGHNANSILEASQWVSGWGQCHGFTTYTQTAMYLCGFVQQKADMLKLDYNHSVAISSVQIHAAWFMVDAGCNGHSAPLSALMRC